MNKQIFREYDIRGVVETDFPPELVRDLGRAFGSTIKRNGGATVSIGYDARPSSPSLFDSLSLGIMEAGVDVINIGLVATPLVYFSLHQLDVQGGVMITGSHNPPEFNGFKLNLGTESIYGKGIQAIADLMEQRDFESGRGAIREIDLKEEYISMIKGKIALKSSPRVVIDAGNGCASILYPRILRELGAEVIELYCDLDGTFPNHHPDPTVPENLKDLIDRVKETGADAGFAYDGDADRVGVVDEKGNILFGDEILMVLARDILKRKPGAGIVYDVKCSKNLEEDIIKRGGKPMINATGHSLIKARLAKEKDAELAGEMSAHIFFKDDYYGYDDAAFATARFLRIMSDSDQKVSDFLSDLPKLYNTPEIRINCPDDVKFGLIADITAWFKGKYRVGDMDGARVDMDGGWGLIRASNTQPVLVLRFEARSEARLKEIKDIFFDKLSSYPSQKGMAIF